MRDEADAGNRVPKEVGLSIASPMKITLTLSTMERIALRRFANDIGADLETAAHTALRDWLTLIGELEEVYDLGEDTETQGSA